MDKPNSQSSRGTVPVRPERRIRQEARSLSESLAGGTSKFFNTLVSKQMGFLNDLSSKIEHTFAPKVDTISNSSESEGSTTPPSAHHTINNPPPRPPPPKRVPSVKGTRGENTVKRMASLPAYKRANTNTDFTKNVVLRKGGTVTNNRRATSEERFSVNGMNVSFDEPIYHRRETNSSIPITDISISDNMSCENNITKTRQTSESSSANQSPRSEPRRVKGKLKSSMSCNIDNATYGTVDQSKEHDDHIGRGSSQSKSLCNSLIDQTPKNDEKIIDAKEMTGHLKNTHKFVQGGDMSEDCGSNVPVIDTKSVETCIEPNKVIGQPMKSMTSKFTTSKRRSNTVDEILFDDYIKPEVDVIIPCEKPLDDLILFEPELKIEQEINSSSSSSEGNDNILTVNKDDSPHVEFGAVIVHRSGSVGSDKSWSSVYSMDSQPDDLTQECMDFMKTFVDKIFYNSEDITQTEKAKFGELCQQFPGRLWFSRYVSSQRVHNKKVPESVFFRLMQYFAVCLFECNEADDFTPAKTLMNMCFTFYYEAPSSQEDTRNVFLYMYMRDQPIWQSLRFWNAAYFDAVQCERSRRPMSTNSDGNETVSDDKQFQENITFGKLGTFACNMREFGLSKELCLEFLRKQSTIANLGADQIKLLKDNIEKVKDT